MHHSPTVRASQAARASGLRRSRYSLAAFFDAAAPALPTPAQAIAQPITTTKTAFHPSNRIWTPHTRPQIAILPLHPGWTKVVGQRELANTGARWADHAKSGSHPTF